MSITTLYLIRHGESVANEGHIYIGHTDMDLTEKGHSQAELTAEYLKDIPADAIYSSDLLRAYHTALHTAKKKDMTVICQKNLREIYAGEWEGKFFDDLPRLYPESFGIWKNNVGLARCDKGESVLELQTRFAAAVEEIVCRHEGQIVFLFTHATPIRAIATLWQGIPPEGMKNIPWATNASVTTAEYENGTFRLLDYGFADFQGPLMRIPLEE